MADIEGATENIVSGTTTEKTLELDLSKPETGGTWRCLAEYTRVSGTGDAKFAKVVVETFLSQPANDAVLSGASVTLSCVVPIDMSKPTIKL